MIASQGGHESTIRLLLDHGADVNIQRKNGLNALMLASQNGHESMVRLLLEYGADKELKNNRGRTAMDCAFTKEIKTLLRDHVYTASYVLK